MTWRARFFCVTTTSCITSGARDGRVKIPAPTIFCSGMPFGILRPVRVFSIWAVRTFETMG